MPEYKITAGRFSSVGRWESERAFEARRAMEDLVNHPGWVIVAELLDEARADVLRNLTGSLQPYEVMARLSGMAEALEAPRQVMADVVARADHLEAEIDAQEAARSGGEWD